MAKKRSQQIGPQARTRIILDTNVWSEIGRRDNRTRLENLARMRTWSIQTPPATLLEVMRTTDPSARGRIVEVMSSALWKRLPSEAESESREFVSEARRCRPGWLKQIPTPGNADSHHVFWTKRVWRDARTNPDKFAATSAKIHGPADKHVAKIAKENRRSVVNDAPKLRDIDRWIEVGRDGLYIEDSIEPDSSRRVEAWRFKSRDVFWHAASKFNLKGLAGSGNTYLDWFEPYLLIDELRRSYRDFSTFWFDDVDPRQTPRIWIRGAVEHAQLLGKVSPSVGRDEQLSSYLPDCDIFVSNDRLLIEALKVVGDVCPFTFPALYYFPNLDVGESALTRLEELLP